MALRGPPSYSTVETPIKRLFRRIMKRPMAQVERRALHLKPAPVVRLHP
jgi:hypothetical protein